MNQLAAINNNSFQGCSALATPIKQRGLVGIYDMLSLMRKHLKNELIFVDLYSGSGTNFIEDTIINGSPISMLEGIAKSVSSMSGLPASSRKILFNDISGERVNEMLPLAVEHWQARNGLPVDRNLLTCYDKKGHVFTAPIYYENNSADATLKQLDLYARNYRYHMIVTIDPNGPKDAPWHMVNDMYKRMSRNLEIIIHISANTLKRVAKARAATNFNFSPLPDHIADIVRYFDSAGGWIRQPVGADQWTMLLLSKFPPRNGWRTADGAHFHLIDSDAGKQLIHDLSLTKKEKLLAGGV